MPRNVQAFEVAAILLRSWLAKMWLPKIPLSVFLTAIAVTLATFSMAEVVFVLAQGFPAPTPVFFGFILIIVHIGAVFAAVLSSMAAAQESSVMAWWRATPLSNRKLGLGLSFPVWGVAAAQTILTAPPLAALFGQDFYLGATALCCVAIGTGTIIGRAFLVSCRALCRLFGAQSAYWAQNLAILTWLLYCALCAYAMQQQQAVTAFSPEGLMPSMWAFLGFPLLVLAPASALAWCWGGLVFWVAVLCVVEWWLWPRAGFEKYDGSTVSPSGFSYLSRGALPVFRLELTRLIRCPRSQASLVCNVIAQSALMMAYWAFGSGGDGGFFTMVVFINAMVAAYYPVIARGLSDKATPYALTMGGSPGRWALAVNLSAAALSFTFTIPFLIIWALISTDTSLLFTGTSLTFFMLSVGGIVGFVLMPAHDTGIVENVRAPCLSQPLCFCYIFCKASGWKIPSNSALHCLPPVLFYCSCRLLSKKSGGTGSVLKSSVLLASNRQQA